MAFSSAATQPPCGLRVFSTGGHTSERLHPILPTHRLPQGPLAFPLHPPRVQALA